MAEFEVDYDALVSVIERTMTLSDIHSGGKTSFENLIADIPDEAQSFDMYGASIKYNSISEDINEMSSKERNLADNLKGVGTYNSIILSTINKVDMSKIDIEKFLYNQIKCDGFVPQGYTIVNGKYLVSAYDGENNKFISQEYIPINGKYFIPMNDTKEKRKSRIYVFNQLTGKYEGYINLPNTAHVGGTSYDNVNEVLYVTSSKGKIAAYDYNTIEKSMEIVNKNSSKKCLIDLSKENAAAYKCDINISKEVEGANAATCYYHNGSLYVATFTGSGDLVKYNVNINEEERKITSNPDFVLKDALSGAVQGVAIYEENEKEYLLVSRSSAISSSRIDKFEITDDKLSDCLGSKIIEQKGLEGIEVDRNGNITGIFEYDNQKSLNINVSDVNNDNKSKVFDLNDYSLKTSGALYDFIKEVKE